jgi:hypothetical protein
MRRRFPPVVAVTLAIVLAVGLFLPATAATAPRAAIVRTPDQARYHTKLRAGASAATWTGTHRIGFHNNGTSALQAVWLRLWPNGVLGCSPRAVRISRVQGGTAATPTKECTAIKVVLDSPVAPGGRGSISMHLEIRLPARNDRFGRWRDLRFAGSALPVLAVREGTVWSLDPYIDIGESFYSLVARYDVTLSTPQRFRVAATGVRADRRVAGGRVTARFVARDVRDFAWAAAPFRRLTGSAGGTRVNVWYLPELTSRSKATDVLRWARASLVTFSSRFGDYPYPEADVVVSAFSTFGGMEYPTLVFSNPARETVAHELAHQWWYGIVGNDEFSSPWLDESFATFSQRLPFGPVRTCGRYVWPSPTARLTNDMAYWDRHRNEYLVVYLGGRCMLSELSGLFGRARFLQLLKTYAADHWLKVARPADFRRAVEDAAATEMPGWDANAFWARWRVG